MVKLLEKDDALNKSIKKRFKESYGDEYIVLTSTKKYYKNDIDDILSYEAKSHWDSFTDEQKDFLIQNFNLSGAEHSVNNFNDYIWFQSEEILDSLGEYFNESIWGNYSDYDPKDGWTEEDIELHKSIDWTGRNYEEYPVEEDSFMHNAVLYGVQGGPIRKEVKFIKYIRSNPIYPPYYGPVDRNPFDVDIDYVGPMYDGFKHGRYDIHDRFETQETYDLLSR